MNRVILTFGLVLLVIPASASTIFYEGFATPGELNTQTGGSGWATPWSAITANTQVQSPGTALTYTLPGGGTVNGGLSALELKGNNDAQIKRQLTTTQTGDVFFSFLFRHSAGVMETNDFLTFWFDNDNTVAAGQVTLPAIGEKVNRGGLIPMGPEDFMVRLQNGANEKFSTQAVTSNTYFIVGRLFKSAPLGSYNRFALWVNPDSTDTVATPDVLSISASVGISSFSYLGVRSANQEIPGDPTAPDIIYVDELRAGTTFNDVIPSAVVPIPEPATLALLGLGMIGLGLSGRNRRRV